MRRVRDPRTQATPTALPSRPSTPRISSVGKAMAYLGIGAWALLAMILGIVWWSSLPEECDSIKDYKRSEQLWLWLIATVETWVIWVSLRERFGSTRIATASNKPPLVVSGPSRCLSTDHSIVFLPIQPVPASRDIALPFQHALLRPSLHWFVAEAAVRWIGHVCRPVPPSIPIPTSVPKTKAERNTSKRKPNPHTFQGRGAEDCPGEDRVTRRGQLPFQYCQVPVSRGEGVVTWRECVTWQAPVRRQIATRRIVGDAEGEAQYTF